MSLGADTSNSNNNITNTNMHSLALHPTHPFDVAMTMSSDLQQPLMAPSNGIMDNLPSPFTKDIDGFPGVLQPPPLTVVPVHRRRRSSKPGMSSMKRSASTPNVRGQAAADAAALSYAADKRRNKLGYHRTSVACGHCRRRKIRCLLAPDDPQGRCSNCIRLKKECNFFPVDQQPQPERRSRAGSKNGRSSGNNSSASSPSSAMPQAQSNEIPETFNQYPAAPMPPLQGEFAVPEARIRNSSVSSPFNRSARLHAKLRPQRPSLDHMHTVPPAARPFDPESRRASLWDSSQFDHSPLSSEPRSALEDRSTGYWRLAESPMTPASYSYAGPSPITPMHRRESENQTFSPVGPHEEMQWPHPPRSMSVGGQYDGYQREYPAYYPMQQGLKHPQPGDIYPPSLNTSNLSVASVSEPASAPAEGQPLHGAFGPQSGWNPNFIANPMNGMPNKAENFGGWYPEPGHLAQVEEEGPMGHFGEETTLIYPEAQNAA
ncbi:MAG: hypothetical protein M1817_003791 [Caeruleum heppii]|nr:MAG: hypothetical protein M1817_003791 [Caeruleum heppii]